VIVIVIVGHGLDRPVPGPRLLPVVLVRPDHRDPSVPLPSHTLPCRARWL